MTWRIVTDEADIVNQIDQLPSRTRRRVPVPMVERARRANRYVCHLAGDTGSDRLLNDNSLRLRFLMPEV